MKLREIAKLNKEIVKDASDELGIPEEKVPILVEKMLNNEKSKNMLLKTIGEFFGRRSLLEAGIAGFGAALGLAGVAGATTKITDQNVIIDDEWYLKAPAPFSALVGIEGSKVIAYDYRGRVIADGEAGVDDATVFQACLDLCGAAPKKRITATGEFTIQTTLIVKSYTILDLSNAKITVQNAFNDRLIANYDGTFDGTTEPEVSHIEIIFGEIDGNRTNQTGEIEGFIAFSRANNIKLTGGYIHDILGDAIRIWAKGYGTNSNIYDAKITIDNLTIHNAISTTYGKGIGIADGKYVTIKDCIVTDCDEGIWFGYIKSGVIDSCVVNNSYGQNIFPSYNSEDIIISNCVTSNSQTQYGIAINTATKAVITGCVSYGNAKSGILVTGASDIIIANNSIHDNTVHGILLDPSLTSANIQNIKIIGNTIYNNGSGTDQNGIWLKGDATNTTVDIQIENNEIIGSYRGIAIYPTNVSKVKVTSNRITNAQREGILAYVADLINNNIVMNCGQALANTYDGIKLYDLTYCVVVGNKSYDDQGTPTQRYGIAEAGTSDYNLIVGNICTGNATGGISTIGLNTVSVNNIT